MYNQGKILVSFRENETVCIILQYNEKKSPLNTWEMEEGNIQQI